MEAWFCDLLRRCSRLHLLLGSFLLPGPAKLALQAS
jgi:hypothetical protein